MIDIKGILNQLQTLKVVRNPFELFLDYYKKIIIVKSKLFFQYGKEGIKISHMLLKYLDKLDLFDIIDLIQGKADKKLLSKIFKYTSQIKLKKKPLPLGIYRRLLPFF